MHGFKRPSALKPLPGIEINSMPYAERVLSVITVRGLCAVSESVPPHALTLSHTIALGDACIPMLSTEFRIQRRTAGETSEALLFSSVRF